MKYVQINAYSGGWAESIVFGKHRELEEQGHDSWVFWARGEHEQSERVQKIASYPEVCLDALLTRIDGRAGFHSKGITRRLLKKLNAIDPDVVHLHLLLGYYINVEMLFEWLASHRCKVVWTLHDCWAFTGHCIHFTYAECEQWRSGCAACAPCPQKTTYPETYFGGDASVRWCFERKSRLFTMLPPDRMRLITPSKWLADLVRLSFLSKYDVEVVHNSIDTNVFRPTPSDFRERYGIGNRFMVLGVASKWTEKKGMLDILRLANELDSKRFAVVLVGVSDKQKEMLASEIVAIKRTESARELAEIYTAADVLFNPTLEDNYPTVNLEAEACGTPIITYDTGGCRETIASGNSKVVSGYEEGVAMIEQALLHRDVVAGS